MTTFDSGATRSLWMERVPALTRAPLTTNMSADACVIGAGIAGLSVAYELVLAGKSVIVLDDGEIGGGQTLLTTAHLASALDDRYYRLEQLHGPEGARLAAHSHSAAIDRIERIVAQENIACDFQRVPGYLVREPGGKDDLERELDCARAAGLAVELLPSFTLAGYDHGPALRFADQAQFDAAAYVAGLVAAIERNGGRIFTHSHVTEVHGGSDARVVTEDGAIVRCDCVVVATNTPFNDRLAIHTKQAPYRTYVVAGAVSALEVPPLLLWDNGDPYHYVRTLRMDDTSERVWLIVGGEDHKTGQPGERSEQARFSDLASWTRDRFRSFTGATHRWSGQVFEPHDALAFIGRNPLDDDNVYVATGDSGNGLTHGTIAGILIADLIGQRDNPWQKIYEPNRITLRAGKEFLRENLNFAAQYKDLVLPGDLDSVAELGREQGGILREGVHLLAVYRDVAGSLHAHSAVCTHLGCAVRWNEVEKSFDCPCHGSRFDALDGHVIVGPANTPLANEDDRLGQLQSRVPGADSDRRPGERA